jgi:probable phosphoglycerate mutase
MQDTGIYLVRHGQALCNLDRIITGQTESPLTDIGRDEALKLRDKLGQLHFDKVISSDLSRAVETARVLAGADADIQQFPALRERYFGVLEGQPDSTLQPLLDAHAKLTRSQQWEMPWADDIESDEHVYQRTRSCIEKIAKDNAGKRILVVAHGGPIRTFLIGMGFYAESELLPGSFKHGCFAHLRYGSRGFELIEIDGVSSNLHPSAQGSA